MTGKETRLRFHNAESRYRLLFEHSPDGIVIIDPATARLLEFNETAHLQLGYSRDEFARLSIADLDASETPDEISSHIQKVIREGRGDFETLHRTRQGEIRHIHVTAQYTEILGRPVYHCIWRDITERRRADEALRDSEERYRLLFNSGKEYVAIHLIGTDGQPKHFIQVNDAACEILGYTREEMLQLSPQDVDSANSSGQMPAFIEKLIENKHVLFETEMISKNGHRIPMEVSVVLFQMAGDQATMCVARDITERKQAEDEINRSNMLLNAIIENIPNTIFLKDAKELRFVLLNRAGEDLTGYSSDDLLGKNDYDFVPKEQADFFTEKDRDVLRGKDVVDIPEEPLQTRNKGVRTLHTKKVPILNVNGEPEYLLGISEDITERKRIESELDLRSKRLAALYEIGTEIISELKLSTLIESIVKHACDLIGGAYCTCYLYRPEMDLLERVATVGESRSPGTQFRKCGEGFIGHIWSINAPFLINDYFSWPGRKREYDSLPPRAMVGVPIHFGDQFLGVLGIAAYLPHQFTQADTEMLGMFAVQAAIAIRNAQHYDQMESQIHDRTIELEETNTALRVLIRKGDKNQQRIEESIQTNVNQLVTPFLSKLKKSKTEHERKTYLNILETNLDSIVSPFINRLSTVHKNLTPKEIQIAELIKQGKRSKEIAELFGVAVGTVITHRNKIRKKLALKSRGANLRSHLLSLP